jgi:hypothetical protein
MAEWAGTVLTQKGRQLLAKALTGDELHVTRVMLGDGQLATGQDPRSLIALIGPKLELPVRVLEVVGDGTSRLQVVLSNDGLLMGFHSREIGVFATDPDEGEILYAYDNAGDKCDYVPGGGRLNQLNLIFDIYMVVDQAENITIVINNSLLFATQEELRNHQDSTNPHPEFLKLGPTVIDCSSVMVQQLDLKTINPMAFDSFKSKVLGGDGTDISIMRGRIDQVEREQSNMALALEAQQLYPDYNALLPEDFKDPDQVDTFECKITSIVAGDDSVDVETLRGIVPGAWYTVSDGVYQERVQIRSVVKNGSTYRVIFAANIQYTYVSGQVTMYRTTAQIQSSAGIAEGAGDQKSLLWQPSIVWTGTTGNTPVTVMLDTSLSNSAAFTKSGDIGFTVDGFVTLV